MRYLKIVQTFKKEHNPQEAESKSNQVDQKTELITQVLNIFPGAQIIEKEEAKKLCENLKLAKWNEVLK